MTGALTKSFRGIFINSGSSQWQEVHSSATQEAEAGGSGVLGYPQLHSMLEASLCYRTPAENKRAGRGVTMGS